jgi:hypothetical protein
MDLSTYLDQGRVWISKDQEMIGIETMSPEWRRNAAKWLLRRADVLRIECRIASFRNECHALEDGTADYLRREETGDLVSLLRDISKPDEWIERTDLYRALVEGLPPASLRLEAGIPLLFIEPDHVG